MSGARSGVIDLADADGIIAGAVSGADVGANVDARDTDGDGRAEILVGATGLMSERGAAFLFYGPVEGALDTSDAAAVFAGERGKDYAGQGVALADIDGDAITDVVVGAPNEHTAGSGAGAVYVVSPE